MNSQPERVHQGTAGALKPVGPSLIVKIVMRPMTKMLNPLIVKLARPAALPHGRADPARRPTVQANLHYAGQRQAQR